MGDSTLALTKAASVGLLEGTAPGTHKTPVVASLSPENSMGEVRGNLRLQSANPAWDVLG